MTDIPNSYIFTLSNGKFGIVQAGFGLFHEAHIALQQWLDANHPEITITESHPWKPDDYGYTAMQHNGEALIFLVLE